MQQSAAVRFPAKALAVPRGHDLSVAGAALSFGAAGRRQPDDPRRAAPPSSWRASIPSAISQLVEKWGITHTQLVPTMFSRMLKLPEEVRKRYDLSSLEIAIHAAAPCPAAGQGRDDQMVGADHPRILRRHRRPRLHRLQQRAMAGPSRHRRQGAARRPAYSRREHAADARRARRARCGSRPRRRSNISTIRPRPRRPARPTAA